MQDALASPQSVLLLGGTSEIGLAIVRAFVRSRCHTVVLAARDPAACAAAADELRRLGATTVETIAFDALDPASHQEVIAAAFAVAGDLDVVVQAFGALGDQTTFDADPLATVDVLRTNYEAVVTTGLAVAERFRAQGHGTLVLLSSVAGARARRSNYVYGSTKAAADAFAQGLGDALVDAGARVVVVRPGFVHSRMTEGMAPQPFATTPDAVADVVVRGLQRGREVIWAPPVLQLVFGVLRLLPRRVWRIVSAR